MGGLGSGGRRAGAGRPRKSDVARALDGRASHTAKVVAHPSVPPQPQAIALPKVDEADAPDELACDERHVWLALFPRSVAAGELAVEDTRNPNFLILCKNIVLERAQRLTDPGSPGHRGIQQAIRVDMERFGVRTSGTPGAAAPAVPVDPLKGKYFGGSRA